jgi:hypothetical protein
MTGAILYGHLLHIHSERFGEVFTVCHMFIFVCVPVLNNFISKTWFYSHFLPRTKQLSNEERAKIGARHSVGLSDRKIAKSLNLSVDYVSRYVKNY